VVKVRADHAAAVGVAEHGNSAVLVSLDALARELSEPIARIAIRVCPTLPGTTEERITDTRAANVADSAAAARGWSVYWHDRDRVFHDAAAALAAGARR
jgi:hypothetical protein